MRRLCILLAVLLVSAGVTYAQNSIVSAKPEETAKLKPLVAAEMKAREALNAKIATLPESKAYNDAKAALDKAAAALNAAAEKLPENAAWRLAGAATLDMAYKIQADHALSSREYQPRLNDKTGDLEFIKLPKQ